MTLTHESNDICTVALISERGDGTEGLHMPGERILLTNDDGPKSPFLLPFVDALLGSDWIGSLQVVIPAEEQSWIGQSVSRFKPIYAKPRTFVLPGSPRGAEGYLVSGTPADCVGVGLHNLMAESADVVISGINLGTNAGAPFAWNSGTVGGARQGVCFGRRAIAVSSMIPSHIFDRCRAEDPTVATECLTEFSRIAAVCVSIVGRLLAAPIWDEVQLLSVNVPWALTAETEWSVDPLERLVYRPLYTPIRDGAFAHHFHGFSTSESAAWRGEGDLSAVQRGAVSIAPLAISPQLSECGACEELRKVLHITSR